MKNIIPLFLLLFITEVRAQNVLRVNNTAGVNVPYTTIAAAVIAAGPSDIIMVEGSLTSYGSLTISKKVKIVGPGYFLSENVGLQANLLPATITNIVLNTGSDGSSFYGLSFPNRGNAGNFNLNTVSSIIISNCSIGDQIFSSGSGLNILINENYMTSASWSGTYTGVIFSNNYMQTMNTGNTSLITFTNNIVTNAGSSVFENADVRNNIFSGSALSSVAGSTIKNNLFQVSTQPGADGTNLLSQSFSSIFIGLSGNTTDSRWKLKAGPPAIGFGASGVDCGIFGGATPYALSGISPGRPTITNFSTPATATQNGTLNVKVSAKVN